MNYFTSKKVIDIFNDYVTHNLEFVNQKYKLKYKNDSTIKNAFKKLIPKQYCEYNRLQNIVFTDKNNTYTLSELEDYLKINRKRIKNLLKKFKTLDDIKTYLNNHN